MIDPRWQTEFFDLAQGAREYTPMDYPAVRPCQMPGRTALPCQGEHRLLFAVLDDAVSALAGNSFVNSSHGASSRPASKRRAREEAMAWFESADDTVHLSYRFICQHLAIEPVAFRRQVLARYLNKDWFPEERDFDADYSTCGLDRL